MKCAEWGERGPHLCEQACERACEYVCKRARAMTNAHSGKYVGNCFNDANDEAEKFLCTLKPVMKGVVGTCQKPYYGGARRQADSSLSSLLEEEVSTRMSLPTNCQRIRVRGNEGG
jgi:hypothetical protein